MQKLKYQICPRFKKNQKRTFYGIHQLYFMELHMLRENNILIYMCWTLSPFYYSV